MKSFQSLVSDYLSTRTPERFGQWFVNRYIKGQWSELFYESNDVLAMGIVHKWLEDLQYIDTFPQKVFDYD
jgi:hypothetical protein